MDLEWRTLQALELTNKNKMLTNIETFEPNDLVYQLVPYSSSLQSSAQKFRQDYIGPLAIDTKLDDTHYLLKEVTGRTLPGDYHINRIKRAKEIMPEGLAGTYEHMNPNRVTKQRMCPEQDPKCKSASNKIEVRKLTQTIHSSTNQWLT